MRKFCLLFSRMPASAMHSLKLFSLLFVLFLAGTTASAQRTVRNPDVIIGELIKVIPSLKDYKAPEGFKPRITRDMNGLIGAKVELDGPELTYYGSKDKGDPVVQRSFANAQNNQHSRAPIPGPSVASVITQNFDGMGSGSVTPADPNMCAGPTAVIQTVNMGSGGAIRIWNLSGTQILAQTTISTLVASPGYAGQGDPVVVYDPLADRYLVNEFGNIGGGNPNTMVMMVSQTNNPLGGWFIYKFQVAFFPDYPKWSAWPNAYYASTNDFNTAGSAYLGSSVWAFNKAKMLAGDATAEAQRFRIFTGSAGSTGSMPVTISGSTPPPAGSPGIFMYFNDNDYTADPNDVDSISMVTFQPNFAVPANTVLTFSQSLVAAPFLSGVGNAPSPASGTYGTLSDRLMFCANYRNFGASESIVLDHTVDANFGLGGGAKGGVRWYELKRTGGNWSINQQSTYAPDGDWRYLGAININSKGQIALGFNLSSTTKFGSILFTGRNSTDALNTMGVQEQIIKAGNAYGSFANRWGDYNSMSTDVVNDSLFWMTAMYGNTASAWGTRLAQFKIGDCDALRPDFTSFTQNAPAIPEGQNIIYNNVVNNNGCVPITNFLLTDTLPTNVTFVSATNGGTYNAGNRVVSWPVNIGIGITTTYQFTVNINAGAYFAPITLLNEPVAGNTIPAGWAATTAVGPSNWVSSTAASQSPPNSLFGIDNATAITDFRVSTTAALALVSPQPLNLSFWHNFSTEPTWDGGVVEISTNGGGTWTDLGPNMTANGYNSTLNSAGTNPIRGRNAFTGSSSGWIQTRVNLASYASQNALFRFRMTSDDNTAAVGWYVDDINISAIAHVDMRTSLFNASGVRQSYRDTITLILPPASCVPPSVTTQPSNTTVCTGSAASFTIAATIGNTPFTYQWQESTNGGGTWGNITNGGIYSGASTVTLNLNPVNVGMNNNQYRCVVTGQCAPNATSNAAVLTVLAGPTVTGQPSNASVCTSGTAIFSVTATGNAPTYQWQENNGGGFLNITNGGMYAGATTNTLTITGVTVGMNNYQYRCVVTSCATSVNSNPGILTVVALSSGGNVNPANTNITCATNSGTLTLSGHTGSVLRWEFSTVSAAGPYNTIANTTTTLNYTNVTVTTYYRAVVQAAGCGAANSTVATLTVTGASPISIIADPGTTLCAGDPTLLTAIESTTGTNVTNSGTLNLTIPDAPSTGITTNLTVVGIPVGAVASSASVKFNITHTWDSDLTLFLKAPNGQVLNLVNSEGGSGDNFTNTIVSSAGGLTFAASAPPFTNTYIADANGGAAAPPGMTQTTATFAGLYAGNALNGTWTFGARDNAGLDVGTLLNWEMTINWAINGPIVGGTFAWSPALGLNATNINPVAASPAATTTYTVTHNNGVGCIRTASITITVNSRPAVTAQPTNLSVCTGSSASFSVTATGTGITYQWQESTNGGVTYTDLANVAPYSNVTSPTLTINPTAAGMNGNRYRCAVSGTCPPVAYSNGAILTLVALPVVTVTPASTCGGVANSFGTALTASGANTYIWAPVSGLYTDPNATVAYTSTNLATVYAAPTAFTIYTVTGTNTATGCSNTASALVNYTPPAPTVTPNPVAMCLGDAAVKLKSSSASYTNLSFCSGPISVIVLDNNPAGAVSSLTVSGVPANGAISAVNVIWNMPHTWDGDMVFALKAPNGQILNLDYYLSTTGGTGPTTGFVNTTVSSTGTNALSSGSNPYTGIFKADAVITNAFGGAGGPTGYTPTVTSWAPLYSIPNGTWTLAMKDGFGGDQGTLTSWCLNLTYVVGVPSTPATWTPIAGLFSDASASTAYVAGTAVDSVWTRPTPAGVYTYQARVNSLPPAPTTVAMSNTATSTNATITFNFKNNNSYPVIISDIASMCNFTGATNVSAYYNTVAVNGPPSAITVANGWNQFGSASITSIGFPNVQPFMSGLSLVVPAGATYGMLVSAVLPTNAVNIVYSNAPGQLIASAGGCDIITGPNIGYSGLPVPAAPTVTPRFFIGSLTFSPSITACTSPARSVVVTVNQPIAITTQPINAVVCTDKIASFSVAVTGTTPSYQWQESRDAGVTWTLITDGGVYSGATTSTLVITNPPVSMNGYQYRCAIAGAAPCATVFTAARLLTVNPLPTVVITASPYRNLLPGLTTTLSSSSSPAAAINTWFRNNIVVPGATGSSYVVDIDHLGEYYLRVVDVNGCVSSSNKITIGDSTSGRVFISPNPTPGRFVVRYNPSHNNAKPRGIIVRDADGALVLFQEFTLGAPFAPMGIDLSTKSTGIYSVEVVDENMERLAVGRVEVVR